MIDLRRDPAAPGPVITGFSGTAFRVQDKLFANGLMLTTEEALDWTAPEIGSLTVGDLRPLLEVQPPPEFLLLGTGASLTHPPRALVKALEAIGIGVEAMDSRAAARAWGVLRGEGRWIVAALLPL